MSIVWIPWHDRLYNRVGWHVYHDVTERVIGRVPEDIRGGVWNDTHRSVLNRTVLRQRVRARIFEEMNE